MNPRRLQVLKNLLPKAGEDGMNLAQSVGNALGMPLWGLLGGSISIGITSLMTYRNRVNDSSANLLKYYGKELASLSGKPEDAITKEDLYQLADGTFAKDLPPITALKESINARDTSFFYAALPSLLTGLIMASAVLLAGTTAASALGLAGIAAGAVQVATGAGSFYLFNQIKPYASQFVEFARPDIPPANIHVHIANISNKLAQSISAKPDMVFAVIAQADPAIQAEIMARYKKPYTHLEYEERVAWMKDYKTSHPIQALTDAINEGRMRPQQLALYVSHIPIYVAPKAYTPENQTSPTTAPAPGVVVAKETLMHQGNAAQQQAMLSSTLH